MAWLPDGTPLKGKLFIVEGIDGSGKSTQLDLVHKWLRTEGYVVSFSEWNSSAVVRQTTRRGKKRHMLTPTTFSIIHAVDFSDRMQQQMLPALKAGAIVLADRYVYTAFARDGARGVDPDWVRGMYSFAVRPTMAFYFRVTLEESLKRIITGRPSLKYYEAGMDLGLSDDPFESYRLFQGRILEEYDRMVDEFGLTVIDATGPIVEQQVLLRSYIKPHLAGALRTSPSPWDGVLAQEGLSGVYLDELSQGETQA